MKTIPRRLTRDSEQEATLRVLNFLLQHTHPDKNQLPPETSLTETRTLKQLRSSVKQRGFATNDEHEVLNRFLRLYVDGDRSTFPGYVFEEATPPRARRRRQQPLPREARATFSPINEQRIRQALRRAFGQTWYGLSLQDRSDAFADVQLRVLESAREGIVSPDVILEFARETRRSFRPKEREVYEGKQDDDQPKVDIFGEASREAVATDEEIEAQIAAEKREEVLAAMRELPGGDLRVLLVQMHLGEGQLPTGRRLQRGQPLADAKRYHPTRSDQCPTCQAISRTLSIPGLDRNRVARTIDRYLLDLSEVF